jgi:hypothetical protein
MNRQHESRRGLHIMFADLPAAGNHNAWDCSGAPFAKLGEFDCTENAASQFCVIPAHGNAWHDAKRISLGSRLRGNDTALE